MNIQTQKFVTKSDLFEGLDTLESIFDEGDHLTITWGGANRTLIDTHYFSQWESAEMTIIVEEGAVGELEIMWSRIKELPEGVMVDLEN